MTFDILLKNCSIVDGTGRKARKGDIGIVADRIAALGTLDGANASSEIDVKGAAVSPGFVDIHSHADLSIYDPDHDRILEPLVRQGITTFVGGNCGLAMAPSGKLHPGHVREYKKVFTARSDAQISGWSNFASFAEYLEKNGMLLNTAILAPHGVMRVDAMGLSMEDSSAEDRRRMKSTLEECLDGGAFGMSCGLQYFPGLHASTEEIAELATMVANADGFVAFHLRSYTNTLEKAIDETLDIARRSGVRVQISHLFRMPDLGWFSFLAMPLLAGFSALQHHLDVHLPVDAPLKRILSKLEKLRGHGDVVVGIDTMPTTTAFTHLLALFPPWVIVGSKDDVMEKLKDPKTREKIRKSIKNGKTRWPHRGDDWSLNVFRMLGWDAIYIMAVVSDRNRKHQGMSLTRLAEERGQDPLDACCDLLLEEDGNVLIFGTLTEPDDEATLEFHLAALLDPNTSIATDTILLGFGRPSHLFYDCYPRYIREFVVERKDITLERAVRKMTSLPAAQAGIKKRGLLRKGYFADLVVFEVEKLSSHSTFQDPAHFPDGISHVFINGRMVLGPDGYDPHPLPGRFLRRDN